MADAPASPFTRDAFYGGRLVVAQPARGHRSGTDAVLLAAAVAPDFAGTCHDMGAGVGVVGLGIALLRPGARVLLVEREDAALALARANASAFEGRVAVACCDILDRAALHHALPEPADLVVTNPPFHDGNRGRPSPDPARRAAHVLAAGETLGDWVGACLDRLRHRGTLVAIVAAASLPEVLRVLAAAGAITVKPVLPRADASAHRVLVRAVKGSRAPFALAAPLVLHDPSGRLTPEADRLHRGDAALHW